MAEVTTALWETVPACVKGCGRAGAPNIRCSPCLHSTSQGNHHCVLKDVFAIANQKTQLNGI